MSGLRIAYSTFNGVDRWQFPGWLKLPSDIDLKDWFPPRFSKSKGLPFRKESHRSGRGFAISLLLINSLNRGQTVSILHFFEVEL
jgi:hypothetical protein